LSAIARPMPRAAPVMMETRPPASCCAPGRRDMPPLLQRHDGRFRATVDTAMSGGVAQIGESVRHAPEVRRGRDVDETIDSSEAVKALKGGPSSAAMCPAKQPHARAPPVRMSSAAADYAPSTQYSEPVTYLAASEAKRRSPWATSSGTPRRPSGIRWMSRTKCSMAVGVSMPQAGAMFREKPFTSPGVSVGPGDTALTRMPSPPTSIDRVFVMLRKRRLHRRVVHEHRMGLATGVRRDVNDRAALRRSHGLAASRGSGARRPTG